jgi:DNA-binding NarL/FixJ family response regulator
LIAAYIVEDHAIVREGLSSLLALSADIQVVGMAGSAEEAFAGLRSLEPDVLLVDIKLPNKNGVELIRELRAENRLPPTLILTTFDDDLVLIEGLKAGAKGYLLKDVGLEQLVGAIREIANGGSHINPVAADRLRRATLKRADEPPSMLEGCPTLTSRETDVLRLMASGMSNSEIAEALAISDGTVKNHVSNILGKLNARDRTKAVLKALQSGMI